MNWDRLRERAESAGGTAKNKWQAAGERHASVGFAEGIYDRDQSAFASVLGSAIALRLFLFVIPANVLLVALVNLLRLGSLMYHHLEQSPTTGSMAKALEGLSWGKSLSLAASSLVLTLWAGRSLTRVLAASAGAAWNLSAKESKAKVAVTFTLSGLIFAAVVSGGVFARLKRVGGVPAGIMSIAGVAATVAALWFLVMLSLPRGTKDPGALLPGAFLFGISYSLLQWFMQLYLPGRIARTADTFGNLATTVAALGNFFFVGRLMSGTFVISAVTYERYGSVSSWVFGLPLLRSLPRRIPRLATFFALDSAPALPEASE